ncbi:MAG: LytTR family transcriptional regulator [Tannerellaceae bacterium]|jgi:hypothetical protein|nr:LytTR family transcriptional regulator [Tannerellaceae bacterium]
MLPNPLTRSTRCMLAGSLLILAVTVLLWGLLILYGNVPPVAALVDASVFIGLLAVCGILSWTFFAYIRVWQAQVAFILLVQVICIGVCYTTLSLLELEDVNTFGKMLPLRLTVGISCWVILMQGYRILQIGADRTEEEEEKEEKEETPPIPATEPADWLDRISVKDGGRIHIVYLNELLYIQACGDYVTLFTPTGQYIKEQTMKYFEAHLPPASFVRIHRSTIVNADQIMRVELFGKENYHIRLKNGASLRASGAGYKLLKERLSL